MLESPIASSNRIWNRVSDLATRLKMAGIRSKDLLCLLQDFPAATLEGLYKSTPACLAVYRLVSVYGLTVIRTCVYRSTVIRPVRVVVQ